MEQRYGVYLSENSPEFACLFIAEHHAYGVLEACGKNVEPTVQAFVTELSTVLSGQVWLGKKEFELSVQRLLRLHSTVSSCSLVVIQSNSAWCYLYNGSLFLKRHGKEYLISDTDGFIEGSLENNDLVYAVTGSFVQSVPVHTVLALHTDDTKEIVDYIKKMSEKTSGALLVLHTQNAASDLVAIDTKTKALNYHNVRLVLFFVGLAISLYVLVQIVLLMGAVLRKNHEAQFQRQITELSHNFKKTEELFPSNPSGATSSVTVLEKKLTVLTQVYPEKKTVMAVFKKKLADMRNGFGTLTKVGAAVFFDVQLIDKNAQAATLSFNENILSILDKKNKKAYTVVADTKKQTTYALASFPNPEFVTTYNNRLFVFDRTKGVVAITGTQQTNIVPLDTEWGHISAMRIFNGNLYLLDTSRDEIYKYFPIGDAFSEKGSYFKSGNGIDLGDARSFAIDYSVYILTPRGVFSFTGGLRQKNIFDSALPVSKLSAMEKNEKVSFFTFLDPSRSRIIVVDNKGSIQKSLFNKKLLRATAVVSPNDSLILFLAENMVYQLDNQ